MKKILLCAVVLGLFLAGCKKKDAPAPADRTTEFLTAQTWKTSGAVSNVPIDTDNNDNTPNSTDLWSSFADCEKDDELAFLSNGTGYASDAGQSCSGASDGQFNWTLSNSTLILNYLNSSAQVVYTQTLTLVSVDANTLKLSSAPQTDSNGVNYIETDTYSK